MSRPPDASPGAVVVILSLAVLLAGLAQSASTSVGTAGLFGAVLLVAGAWRRLSRPARVFALAGLAGLAPWPAGAPEALQPAGPERAFAAAQSALVTNATALRAVCQRLANDPALTAALTRDAAARTRAFGALESARLALRPSAGLLLLDAERRPLAWSGSTPEPASLRTLPEHPWTGPGQGAHGATLLASAPVGRPPRAWVVAELRAAEGLSQGTGADLSSIRLRPIDSSAIPPSPEDRLLTGPDGPLFLARHEAAPRARPRTLRPAWLAPLGCGLLVLAAGLGSGGRGLGWRSPLPLALGVVLRLAWSLPGCAWPVTGSLTAPEVFAWRRLGAWGASPLDLLLTTLVGLHAALLLARWLSLPRAPRWPLARLVAGGLLPPALVVAALLLAQVVQEHSARPLSPWGRIPGEPALLALHFSLALALAAVALLGAGAWAWAAPSRPTVPVAAVAVAVWTGVVAAAAALWPRGTFGLPLLPALGLLATTLALAATRSRWWPWLRAGGAPAVLLASAGLAALVGLLLQPSLVHFSEKAVRRQIREDWLPLVQRQPAWRAHVLQQSLAQLDRQDLLEKAGAPERPAEELAYLAWSRTDLAAFALSSAVELLDPRGGVVSRFSLELPSLPHSDRRVASEGWQVARDQLTLGSARRSVLHAARHLGYHGQVHGEVHVYVADDYADLPFLPRRSPYRRLVGRPAEPWAASPVLLVYEPDGQLRFSSAGEPARLPAELTSRLRAAAVVWTTLDVAGRPHHVLFERAVDGRVLGLGYARLDAPRFLADTLEAAVTLSAVTLLAGLLVLALGSALGSPTVRLGSLKQALARRFGLRLLAAFVGLSVLPVLLIQTVVRGFVRDRLRADAEAQAIERAGVARKAVEDYLVFQRGDELSAGLDDAALVWIASLIRSDLDVFDGGRLVASSRRELYAPGLLSPRLDGQVFRRVVLEGEARVVAPLDLAGAALRAASVPVRLGSREPGVLSVPLDERPQELAEALDDLDRTLRLASALFVLVAAVLAGSVARRISGPLAELTRATRRLAEGDLSTRVETASRDELRDLVDSFNQMAADLARQRQELERSNRLAAWAEMARQVAHEVKNPLTPIQLSAEHLRRVYGDPRVDFEAALELCTQTILRQVRQLRGMVTEFSAFARPAQGEAEQLDVARLLEEACRPYQVALPPGVELRWEAPPGLPPLHGERRLLERALVNGIENALHAVGSGGVVTVLAREQDGVEIEVRDDGPGIADPQVIPRLFEPFFSTKTGGSGLGLALVRKIVEDHAGHVELRSEPGCTRLVLRFPPAPGSARPGPATGG